MRAMVGQVRGWAVRVMGLMVAWLVGRQVAPVAPAEGAGMAMGVEADTTPLLPSLPLSSVQTREHEGAAVARRPRREGVSRRREDRGLARLAADKGAMHWHFRSCILDRLDEYFVCIRRLRTHAPEDYRTFSRLGFAVAPDVFSAPQERLEGPERPTFGGIFFPRLADPVGEEKTISPSFVYFRKLRSAGGVVQAWPGEVYELVLVYDDRSPAQHWQSKLVVVPSCHIGVAPDGAMTILRELVTDECWIRPNARHPGGRRPPRIKLVNRTWKYPAWVLDFTAEHAQEKRNEGLPTSPEYWIGGLLCMALRTHVRALDRIIIRAKRDGCVAAFGIELPRAKAFFKDRDSTALARDGRRKRIFHSVRAHDRQVAEDKTVGVRAHYRGLRLFDWNGYGIRIVLPERAKVMGFNIPGQYAEDQNVATGMVPEEQGVAVLQELLEA